MQKSLCLENQFSPVRQTKEVAGFLTPWEVAGYFEDFETASRVGGLFDLSHWGVVRVEGPDAADYLHRMSTVDIKKGTPSSVTPGAFLTGRGTVLALGDFLFSENSFDIVVAPGTATATLEHIEKFHFMEKFETTDVSAGWALFGLWNTSVEIEPFRHWSDPFRPSLRWVKVPRAEASAFLQALRTQNVALLGGNLFEYFRILAGVPQVGIETGEKDIILEANWDAAVARNKGCYPGQEVVERIFTYGQVNRKLLPVQGEGETVPPLPLSLQLDEKILGQVVSAARVPDSLQRWVGLAYVGRAYWEGSWVVGKDARVRLRPVARP